jgi:hypothetical protein
MVRVRSVLNLLACGIALLGYVPLFPYLEVLPRLFFPAALASGLLSDKRGLRVPPWISTLVSLLFFVYYLARFTRDNFVEPAVNLLVILLAVRLFSEKSDRNYLQIFALALFCFTSSSLFNLSPVFLVYLFLILVLIAVSLVILTFHSASSQPLVSPTGLKKILSVALMMPTAALPLMLVLFFILPRTQFPLWDFLTVGGGKVTGFSEKVEPGTAASVGEVKNVVFRVRCDKLPVEKPYWRGIVLNSFEGNAWVRRGLPPGEEVLSVKGQTIRQTIFPEPGRIPWLMALNIPRYISGVRHGRENDLTFASQGGGLGRIRYEAVSALGDVIETRRAPDREFYLKVPGTLSRRLVDLGMNIAAKGKSDGEKISLLENYYSGLGLTYATTNLPVGDHPLDDFLFVSKRGHCEFFASSFAALLRVAGLPARLVGGYYGGLYNEIGSYYVVSEEMAHVWVEAYVDGKGWVTIDPSRWAVNFPAATAAAPRGLRMAFDAFSYYWNLTVINYDLERQLRLVDSAGTGLKRLPMKTFLTCALAALLLGVAAMVTIRAVKPGKRSRENRVLALFFRKVKREYRFEPAPDMGLFELSALLKDDRVSRFVALYGDAVYHDRKLGSDELRELKRIIGSITGKELTGGYGSDRSREHVPESREDADKS